MTHEENERPVKEKVWLMVNIAVDNRVCILGAYKHKWKAERDQKLAEKEYSCVLVIEQVVIQ